MPSTRRPTRAHCTAGAAETFLSVGPDAEGRRRGRSSSPSRSLSLSFLGLGAAGCCSGGRGGWYTRWSSWSLINSTLHTKIGGAL